MRLLHGTTLLRAKRIRDVGPDPRYLEPGGLPTDDGFSTNVETGPFLFGTPEQYARSKAAKFPSEGGGAILILEVPDRIIQKTDLVWYPVHHGLIQFDTGAGIAELLAGWTVIKQSAMIRSVP